MVIFSNAKYQSVTIESYIDNFGLLFSILQKLSIFVFHFQFFENWRFRRPNYQVADFDPKNKVTLILGKKYQE